MGKDKAEADRKVIERLKQAPAGATPLEIAKTFLGPRARVYGPKALTMIGLGIASRLCKAGLITPTRANRFVVRS